ncbi:glycoside hydrolase family 13 protein [Aliiglaciecola sp. LCG003]|uniref:glycoside hydrolase family 13 protein n=1 Tax=Aliiglaciecola sp. LCG003 TaxID=3053655 RepID=UPI0025730EF2|nr:glycoside hydrolase family 13 protein [Aliiglaciecola sp. LCG003]WJG07887.1 glycoside hydrolase family 13 protein [Aliiglaciecola sp. LCG003]
MKPIKCLLALLVLSYCQVSQAITIQHLEPAFWWTGMSDSSLQLMVHGDNIAETTPQISYPGVQITSMEKTDNANYLFINLQLSKSVQAGNFDIVFNQQKSEVARFDYELKPRKQNSAKRLGFSAKDVIYLITPDRFSNGDPDNDTVVGLKEGVNREQKGGRHGGDLQGIINHLDYIEEMGFSQIWTMPIMQNDMHGYSYHGYSTTDYYQVDPRLGSNQLYLSLSEQAASRGIGLIQDVILNHIGSEHWWMKDLPSKDWINNNAKFTPTTHMREVLHDPHAAEADKRGFNDGWFVPTMPDLNQRNPLVAKYLIQNAIWWIEYAQLSGLRVDTYSYSDMAFLSQWTQRIMQEYPNLNIVGEEWSVNPAIVAFWQHGSKRHSDYQSWLPSVMDFPTQQKLINGLTHEEKWGSGLIELYESLTNDYLYGDPYNLLVFADNHDMSRIFTQLDEDEQLYYMAISYLLTTRGIPQIFYGTEILMSHSGSEDHGVIRSDFPGGWPQDEANAFSGVGLTTKQQRAQTYLKKLLNWRKTNPAVTQGKLTHYAPQNGLYVYFRHFKDSKVMVILNKNPEVTELKLARFTEMLQHHQWAKNIMTDLKLPLKQSLNVPAKSASVLELQ